ncbi:MAG: hypothetical protein GY811_09545 [Myxococcales bacterium]|nr:hypothetical protein [Myxococcales bacterium]
MHALTEGGEITDSSPLARIAVKRVAVPLSGEIEISMDAGDPENYMRAIRQATSRSRMSDLVSHLLEHGFDNVFSAGMLLLVREELLVGWKGFIRGAPEKSVDTLAIPLSALSMLQAPCASRDSFFGFPETPASIEQQLWHYLGEPQREIAILPVEVNEKLTCMLYVQSSGQIPAERTGTLGELTRSISSCLPRLVRNAGR